MGLPLAERLATPAARTSIYYTTLYMTQAVSNPFLAIWLAGKGIGAEQIGVVNALPIFLMIVVNLVVGRLADKASDWRSVIIAGSVFAAVVPIFLFWLDGYVAILVIWALVIIPFQAISPVVDAATYRMARRSGIDFGAMRVWGTLGFIAMTVVAGLCLGGMGAAAFVPLLVAASIIRAVAAFGLPLLRGGEEERAARSSLAPLNPLVATRLRHVWRPWFFLPLLGAALLHGSHMMQMGFGALVWQEQGLSGATIGMLWAVAPAGEVLTMFFFERISRRFAARHLILLACLCGAVRWWGFGLQPDVWGLVLLQVLHMGSFGLAYVGIVNFIANWTSEDMAAEAQSFFSVLRQVVTVLALTGFGYLTAHAGASAFYVASVLAVLGILLTVVSLWLKSPRHEH